MSLNSSKVAKFLIMLAFWLIIQQFSGVYPLLESILSIDGDDILSSVVSVMGIPSSGQIDGSGRRSSGVIEHSTPPLLSPCSALR